MADGDEVVALRQRVADAERVAQEMMTKLVSRTKELRDAGNLLQAAQSRERKLNEALAKAKEKGSRPSEGQAPLDREREKELVEALAHAEAELAKARIGGGASGKEQQLVKALEEQQRASQMQQFELNRALREQQRAAQSREQELRQALSTAQRALAIAEAAAPSTPKPPRLPASSSPQRSQSGSPSPHVPAAVWGATVPVPFHVRVQVAPGGIPLDEALQDMAKLEVLEDDCEALHDEIEDLEKELAAVEKELAAVKQANAKEQTALKQQLWRKTTARDQVAQDAMSFLDQEGNFLISLINELIVVRRYSGQGRGAQLQQASYNINALLSRLRIVETTEKTGTATGTATAPLAGFGGRQSAHAGAPSNPRARSRPTSAAGMLNPVVWPGNLAMYGETPFHGRFPRPASGGRSESRLHPSASPPKASASALQRPQSASALPRPQSAAAATAMRDLRDVKGLYDPRADLHELVGGSVGGAPYGGF